MLPKAPGTDWDEYYAEYPVPGFIGTLMWRTCRMVLTPYLKASPLTVVELGGADSDVYHRLVELFDVGAYHAVDTNVAGLVRLCYRCPMTKIYALDILSCPLAQFHADLVISTGVIEHFTPDVTRRAIDAHFDACRPGGLVLMTFPRPTWLYWATRTVTTWLGLFSRDLYERPLRSDEILPQLEAHGDVLAYTTVWSIGLTQSVTLTRKRA